MTDKRGLLIVLLALGLGLTACNPGGTSAGSGATAEPGAAPGATGGAVEPGGATSAEEFAWATDPNCTETNPHPIGQSLAETYEVPYEEVMIWFCSGFPFEEISQALITSELSGVPPEDLLIRRIDQSWEEIWKELGIVP
jgi:hypothetical protein